MADPMKVLFEEWTQVGLRNRGQRCGPLLPMCLCLLDITMSCARMAEQIEMPFEM